MLVFPRVIQRLPKWMKPIFIFESFLSGLAGPDVGITSWGSWSEYLNCPSGVIGFKLRNEKLMMSFMIIDDFTSLNGIQLLCADNSVTSQLPGDIGVWDEQWNRYQINSYFYHPQFIYLLFFPLCWYFIKRSSPYWLGGRDHGLHVFHLIPLK